MCQCYGDRMPGIYIVRHVRAALGATGLITSLIVFLPIDGDRPFPRLRAISGRQGPAVS